MSALGTTGGQALEMPVIIIITPGDVVLFSISFFLSFFVSKITRKRLGSICMKFLGRCRVIVGRPGYIFGQFRETAR